MISTSGSLTSGGDFVLPFALGVSLTICFAHICFCLIVIGIGFWCLADGVALWARFFILILSLEVTDPDINRSSSESNS